MLRCGVWRANDCCDFVKNIADTGLLAAALDKSDPWHHWGAKQLRQEAPFYTCDAVLAELSFVINNPIPGLRMVARGDLILDFELRANLDRVLELLDKVPGSANGIGGRLPGTHERADRCLQDMDGGQGRLWRLPPAWPGADSL